MANSRQLVFAVRKTVTAEGAAEARVEDAEAANTILPSFFVVGPPRTGTTWLHDVLTKHILLPSPTNETRFFDLHFHRGFEWYLRHFDCRPAGRVVGEIAPTYLASPEARERIARTLPHARIICIFRNPVHRLLSLYRIKRAYGIIPWTLEEAISKDPELIASSDYATHLKAWQSAFGSDRVLPTLYEDLQGRPQAFLDTLLDFVGAPRLRLSKSQIRHVHSSDALTLPRSYRLTRSATLLSDWLKAQRFDHLVASLRRSPVRKLLLEGGPAFTDAPEDLLHYLHRLFVPQITELEAMLGRDLSAWKSPVASRV